jgi:hypothetical protein
MNTAEEGDCETVVASSQATAVLNQDSPDTAPSQSNKRLNHISTPL